MTLPGDADDLPSADCQTLEDTLELVALLLEPARRLVQTLEASTDADALEEAQAAISDAVREARTVIHLAAITPVYEP